MHRAESGSRWTDSTASIMGWSEAEVERIRRTYVDDTARQIALGIARGLAPIDRLRRVSTSCIDRGYRHTC